MIRKVCFLVFSLVMSNLIFISPALSAPSYVDMNECDVNNPITQVCYISGTIERDSTTYLVGSDFELAFSDNTADRGASFSLVVSEAGPVYRGGGDFGAGTTAAQEGDIANFVVLYPTSLAIGQNLKTATWALHASKDFTYQKEITVISGTEVVKFTIEYEYLTSVMKLDCAFDDSEFFDFGFMAPKAACEQDDRDQTAFVNRTIDFFGYGAVGTIPPLDGGYVSWTGMSLSWALSTNSFWFQMIGPRYKSDGTRNAGQLEVYLPASAIDYFFGFSFEPNSDLVVSRTDFAPGATITDVLEAEDGVTLRTRDGGLVMAVESYLFSAPAFSFSNPNKPENSSSGAENSSSGGGGASSSSLTTVTPVIIPTTTSTPTINRSLKTRVRLSKIESLADFTVKPGQRLKIGIKKSSKGQCSISNGRVIATSSGDCVVRVTKFTKKGKKIKRFVTINYS